MTDNADATEAAQGRVERYEVALASAKQRGLPAVDAVIAVADQEQAELRAEVGQYAVAYPMTLARAEAAEGELGMMEDWKRAANDMIEGWRAKAEAAEARVAELEATVAKVRAEVGLWPSTNYTFDRLRAILAPDQPESGE